MDWGIVATVGVFLLGILNTWLLVLVKTNARRYELLQQRDHEIAEEVQRIDLMVQGKYLQRDEFTEAMRDLRQEFRNALGDQTRVLENLFARLSHQIDGKVDKVRG